MSTLRQNIFYNMTFNLKSSYSQFVEFVKPFKNILYFLFLFFLFEFFWKLFVHEGDNEAILLVFGHDLTSFITPLCRWIANICYWIIHDVFGYDNFNIKGQYIYFSNSIILHIVWGCTALKQMLLFTFIIACFGGSVKRKLIFIPASIVLLFLFNILRLVITCFVVKNGFPDWFIAFNESFNGKKWDNSIKTYWTFYEDWYHFFHDHIFKWVYYDGVIFILWLLWVEKIGKPKKTKDVTSI